MRALSLLLVTAVMLWTVQVPPGSVISRESAAGQGHGVEFHLISIAGLMCLRLTGGGALSIDQAREAVIFRCPTT